MNRPIRSDSVAAPAAAYELAMVSPANSTLLHTAGIVGTRPDGSVPDDVGEQAEVVWSTILTILTEAGFDPSDIVSYTTYVVVGEDLTGVMAARDAALLPHTAASTLVSGTSGRS